MITVKSKKHYKFEVVITSDSFECLQKIASDYSSPDIDMLRYIIDEGLHKRIAKWQKKGS